MSRTWSGTWKAERAAAGVIDEQTLKRLTLTGIQRPAAPRRPAPALALAPVIALAVAVAGVLIGFAHGYGYHRDELYFLVAGDHLAWSYPDQGPLTPLIAHLMNGIGPGSLTVLRTPSALMIGGTVITAGLITYEIGGSARAQLIAAGCTAAAPVVLSLGHLLSTSTYDMLAWSLVTWLILRALRVGSPAPWLLAGVVAGTALLNKPLIAFLLVAVLIAIALVGPRECLRSPWPWIGASIALALWSPWLAWQAEHGWPQLHISSSIASGGSASSQPRWALIPFQFLLAGPPLAPVWVAGLAWLTAKNEMQRFRWLAVTWLILVVVFEASGGKPYYLSGLLPALFGAGAMATDVWLDRGRHRLRRSVLTAALALSAAASAVLALPILPAKDAGPVVAMNSDIGETIGWTDFVHQVARVFSRARQPAVVLTSNYGEAGAIDRFGSGFGLPRAYSGHNGFGEWGPPPPHQRSTIVVGYGWTTLLLYFRNCQPAAVISNSAGIDNEENGKLIALCAGTRAPWRLLWTHLRHLS